MTTFVKILLSNLLALFFIIPSHTAFAGPYEDGIKADGNRDYITSFPAFQKAVAEGHVKAHLRLANNYRFGKGTAKSGAKAIALYEKAAALGELSAYAEIAGMYEYGEAVSKSPTKAAEWAKKGAEAGHFLGQYKYARALQSGQGVTKDVAKALYWYQLAGAEGHMMSRGRRDVLIKQGVVAWQPPQAKPEPIVITPQLSAETIVTAPPSIIISTPSKTIPSPTDKIKTVEDIFNAFDVSLQGDRVIWADYIIPKQEQPGEGEAFRFTRDLILPSSLRNGPEKVVSDTFMPRNKFVSLASSKKKTWANKKRPKDGTGYGKYLQGAYTTVGNWTNYRLDGEFQHYYKNALVFEGEAKNGIVKRGISYKLEPFFPLYSSRYSDAEFEEIVRTQKGTYSVPVFSGNWAKAGTDSNGYSTYVYGGGTEFYSPGSYSRPPHFEHLRVTQRKILGNKSVPHGLSVHMKMVMWEDVYYHELETISNYKDGKLDGTFIDYKGHWDIVITDFKNGEYAGTKLTVIDKEDRTVQTLPYRNFKANKWTGMDNHMLEFRSVRAQAEIDRKIREQAARKKAKKDAEELEIRTASKQTGFDYYDNGNFQKSYRILHRYAGQGHSDAQNLLGLMHQYGYGRSVNMRIAKDYLLKSANQDFPAAQYNLGWIYYHVDTYQSDRDEKKAKFWIGKSAGNGFAAAIEALEIFRQDEAAAIAARQQVYYKENKWSLAGLLVAASQSNYSSTYSGTSSSRSSSTYNRSPSYSAKTYSDPFGGLNPWDSEYQTQREIKCRACTYQNRYD